MLTTGSSFSLHPTAQDAATVTPAQPAQAAKHHFSFGDLLDIVNPLQHLPVVGTLYRAVTGDEIGTPAKLVGDAIYGGPWGLVSSLADTAFQSATGKSFGDTVLSLITGKHDETPTAVAEKSTPATQPAPVAQPHEPLAVLARQAMPVIPTATQAAPIALASTAGPSDEAALANSLAKNNVASDMAQRALYAYRRSLHAQHPSAFGLF